VDKMPIDHKKLPPLSIHYPNQKISGMKEPIIPVNFAVHHRHEDLRICIF